MKSIKFKKVITLCLAVCLVCLLTTVGYAKEATSFDSICKKHDLKIIDIQDVPSHIQPIKVNSLEELDKLITDFDAAIQKNNSQAVRVDVNSDGDVGTESINVGALEKEAQDFGPCSQMIYTSFEYDTVPYKRFMDVRVISSYLKGNTTAADYTHIDDWYSIIDAGRTLSASVTGHVILYVGVDKKVVFHESYATNDVEFYNSEI